MFNYIKQLIKKMYPNAYKYSPAYMKLKKEIKNLEASTGKELIDFQEKQLRKLLIHCYKNVPYYAKIMKERKIDPFNMEVTSFELLAKLPILTKEIFRNNINEIQAKNYKLFKSTWRQTSGSTGEPTKYMQDRYLDIIVNIIVSNHYRMIGYNNGYIAVFRGTMIDDFGKTENIYRIKNNQIHFSTFNMNEKTMKNYIQILNKYKPEIIRGYSSSLLILFKFAEENNLQIYAPKAIHTSSEVLTNELKNLVNKLFQISVFDYYSQGEAAIIAYQTPKISDKYRYLPYFSFVEFVQVDDQFSSIVGTNLWNYSMPLLRYETEDLTTTKFIDSSNFVIKDIIGRKADIIEGENGIIVSPISFYHYWKHKIDNQLEHKVSFYQVVQKKNFLFLVKIVKKVSIGDEKIIKKELQHLLGNINVEFEYLERIPTGQKWRTSVREK